MGSGSTLQYFSRRQKQMTVVIGDLRLKVDAIMDLLFHRESKKMLKNSNCDISTIKRSNVIGSIVLLRSILGPRF